MPTIFDPVPSAFMSSYEAKDLELSSDPPKESKESTSSSLGLLRAEWSISLLSGKWQLTSA